MEAYALLLDWLTLLRPGKTLDDFVSATADRSLQHEIEILGYGLFSKSGTGSQWNGRNLARPIGQHRRALHRESLKPTALTSLNP